MALSGAVRNSDAAPEHYEVGQVIILWDDAFTAQEGVAWMQQEHRLDPLERSELSQLGGSLAVYQVADHQAAVTLRDQIRQRFPTWSVDLHVRLTALAQPRLYAARAIDWPQPPPPTVDSVKVGLLDGPVADIPGLAGVSMTKKSFLAATETPAGVAHGTTVAALIAGHDAGAGFSGVAPGVKLFAGTVLRAAGSGADLSSGLRLLQGLDWLAGQQVQVINLSLGGVEDAVSAKIFARLVRRPLVVVAAAGNSGPQAPPSYPAAYPGVLAVAAVDAVQQPYSQGNRGGYIAISAPGVDVWAPDGGGGYYATGTSFSSALVAGGVAVLAAKQPGLAGARARHLLCDSARDLGQPGPDPVFGCGVMQLSATLRKMDVR